MKTLDLYTRLRDARGKTKRYELFDSDPELRFLKGLARSWDMPQESVDAWFDSPEAQIQRTSAETYLREAPEVVRHIEKLFGRELPGTLVWMPSFGEFDGFARYDLGEHWVLLGIDLPGSNPDYMKALTAHELSHVYRDHAPAVWAHLGKPLRSVTRQEYLDAGTAQEHLISEGLATLFSQQAFPDVPPVLHHFYEEAEWQWCVDHHDEIHRSLTACLSEDEDVGSFYAPSRVARGSPSRTHYFWAARRIAERLRNSSDPLAQLIELHERPASFFTEFDRSPARHR